MRKSLWSPDEDEKLRQYVAKHGCGNWSDVAKHTGLHRCGKSCRLRWINYLRPDLKRGPFTAHEVRLVVNLHNNLGNSWSKIATHLPGRTDNDVKNFWHSYTRSRRLQQQQQQQRQRMDNIGRPRDKESYNTNEEKPCYVSDVYKNQTGINPGVKKESKEDIKEHGYAHHLPPLMFTSNNNSSMNKGVVDRKVPSIRVDNAQAPFHFSKGQHNQLPSSSSNTSITMTNTNHSNRLPPSYNPTADRLPPPREVIRPTNFKPLMLHNHLDPDSECAIAASIYTGLRSHLTTSTPASKSNLGSIYISSSFDHSTPSLEASNSAVSSTSHIDRQNSSDMPVHNAADHECSLMFSPSMQVNYLTNSHAIADDAPAASFDQANFDTDSQPPEGLQSVIWRFFNQQDADHPAAAGLASSSLDHERAHISHHFPYHHQKPTSISIRPFSLGAESDIIQPPIQLSAATDQLLNVEDAFSSTANLQYLQAQLAADCFS